MTTQSFSIVNPGSRSPFRSGIRLLPHALAFAWLALSPTARAVDPPPDGGYPGNNTAEGEDALFSLTSGTENTAIGFNALFNLTTGFNNTAVGQSALYYNTTGDANTATGALALLNNTEGFDNTATGVDALYYNTTGMLNTATGVDALFSNTTGDSNTATGVQALESNTTGIANTATGVYALFINTEGFDNTATGVDALYYNTTGNANTATGVDALFNNTNGTANTATGIQALERNTSGSNNAACGYQALGQNTIGGYNIALGYNAGFNLTTGSSNIDIGNNGVAAEANTIRIGTKGTHTKTFIAGISGATVARGVGVIIDSSGRLGTVVSSGRFKDAIKPMDNASESILALKPVTFRYKHELDPDGIPQFGLVAEEVEKVNPDLVVRDEQGKPYTVRYEAVNAMLLNEFLKEHRRNEEQQTEIESLKGTLKEQAAQIQKVSAQLQVSKAVPQLIANDR